MNVNQINQTTRNTHAAVNGTVSVVFSYTGGELLLKDTNSVKVSLSEQKAIEIYKGFFPGSILSLGEFIGMSFIFSMSVEVTCTIEESTEEYHEETWTWLTHEGKEANITIIRDGRTEPETKELIVHREDGYIDIYDLQEMMRGCREDARIVNPDGFSEIFDL